MQPITNHTTNTSQKKKSKSSDHRRSMSLYKVALTNSSFNSSVNYHSKKHQQQTLSFVQANYVEGKIYYMINEGYYAFYPHDSYLYYRISDSQTTFLDQAEPDHWHSFHYSSSSIADKYVLEHVEEFIAILDHNHMEVMTYVLRTDYEEALERALLSSATNTLSPTNLRSPRDRDYESFDSDEDEDCDLIEDYDERRRKSRIDAAFLKFLEDDDDDEGEYEGSDEIKSEEGEARSEGSIRGEEMEVGMDSEEVVMFDYSWNKENNDSITSPATKSTCNPSFVPSFSSSYCGKIPSASFRLKKRRYNQEIC